MFLIVVSRISPMTLFLPAVTSADAGHDAWIAVLLATAAGAVISQIPAVLAARFPKMSLGAYAKQICGRLLGLLVAVIGAAFFF